MCIESAHLARSTGSSWRQGNSQRQRCRRRWGSLWCSGRCLSLMALSTTDLHTHVHDWISMMVMALRRLQGLCS